MAYDFVCPQSLQEGRALKLLATASRLDIEDFLQKKVFLEVPTYCKLEYIILSVYSFALESGSIIWKEFIFYSWCGEHLNARHASTGRSKSERELAAR